VSAKKWIPCMAMVIMLFLTTLCSANGLELFYDGETHIYTGNLFKLIVNETELEPVVPPIVFSDYSLVPARAVFQDGLGAEVAWNASAQKVTVTLQNTKLVMFINQKTAMLDGATVMMPIAPKIINDYTMIPARFVGEQLGMTVDFDSDTDTISITDNKKQVIQVSKVKYKEVSDTKTTLTLITDTEKPEHKAFMLEEPTRLVLDVIGGVFSKIPDVIEADNGNVSAIRFGQQTDAARIVVDLTADLGYSVRSEGKNIIVTITVDQTLAKPEIKDIFELVTYGYEGGRDYVKINCTIGNAIKKGNKVTIPISGENLPDEPAEKDVTGFFGQKMVYTPGKDATEGTITIELKSSDAEMYMQENEVRLKSVHKALPRSVTLDAGHGGADGGAVAYDEDGEILAKEKDFNLDVALRAQKLLEAEGVEVHMIRSEDVYVDYLRVGSIANDAGTSLFVSIHTNSATTPTANGIETYGYLEAGSVSNGMTSQRLSEILLENLLEETEAYDRGVKDGKGLAVVNSTKMPATLIEIGFISNLEECEKMMTEAYRQKLAQAVCDGVLQAFTEMGI